MAAKISNWLGTGSHRSHLSGALLLLVPRHNCQKCGNISKSLQLQLHKGEDYEDRIISWVGKTAPPHAVPWQVFIFRYNRRTRGKTWLGLLQEISAQFKSIFDPDDHSSNYTSLCGGSVIAKRYVLTAYHCLDINSTLKADEISKDSLHVYLGRHHRLSGGSKYGVSTISLHAPDFALLRLDRDIVYSLSVWPVCLPKGFRDRPEPGTRSKF